MSKSLWPQGLQHTRGLLCPSLPPGVCSNSCSLNQYCHSTISSSVTPFSSCPQSFPASGLFPNEVPLHIRWPKSWSFNLSISPSYECSGLNSLRIDWFDLQSPRDTQESSPAQFKSINSLIFSLFYGPSLTSIHDVNYKLPLTKSIANNWTTKVFAICLYGDWTPCCYSCWPSTTPEGVQGGVRHSVLQGIWWDRSLDSWMFLGTDFMISILTSPHI